MRYLRTATVTLLICLALLAAAGVIIFRAHHLSFYDPQHSATTIALQPGELAVVGDQQGDYTILPYGGYVLDTLRQPLGLIGLVYLPSLLIALYEVNHLSRRVYFKYK